MHRNPLLLAALFVLTLPALSTVGEPPEQNTGQQRVILELSQHHHVAGFIQLEEDQVIVVRDRSGTSEPYLKSRINRIVRLHDIEGTVNGTVRLRNGKRVKGVISRDGFDEVVVIVGKVPATFERSLVESVILQPPFEEVYRDYKDSLKPGQHTQHFQLCQWLFEQGKYELARLELVEVLAATDMPEAHRLLKFVEAQLRLSEATADSDDHTTPGDAPSPALGKDSTERDDLVMPADQALISHDDVNIMRVYEINFADPPRVSVSPDTIRQLLEQYGTDARIPDTRAKRDAMFRADAIDMVKLMFDLKARDLYPQIKVITEPHALNEFRTNVHDAWLIPNCATTGCHGGPNAGRLMLYRERSQDIRTRYTNLLILERLELDPRWPLINYDRPEMSVVLQHALPRNLARLPHPDVRGFKPICADVKDRVAQNTIEWIRSMMPPPRPRYPVAYEPPQVGRTTDKSLSDEHVEQRQER